MYDLTKLTNSDFSRAFEGARSKNPGRFEYELADLMCHKADDVNARRLSVAYSEFVQDWLERADKLPNGGRG